MRHEVTEADTATALGGGDVPVLATPRPIAWMEAATVRSAAPHLGSGQTSVGTSIRIEHCHPTPVGDSVEVVAEAPGAADRRGRRLTFLVRVIEDSGTVVVAGEIDLAIVDRDRFLA